MHVTFFLLICTSCFLRVRSLPRTPTTHEKSFGSPDTPNKNFWTYRCTITQRHTTEDIHDGVRWKEFSTRRIIQWKYIFHCPCLFFFFFLQLECCCFIKQPIFFLHLLKQYSPFLSIFAISISVVVTTTAQLHSTKPELRFCAGSNPAACRRFAMVRISDNGPGWK